MKFKMKRFVDLIERMGEVTFDNFDQSGQSRLTELIKLGIIVKTRTGPWSGYSYYKVPENRKGHQKYEMA